MNIQLSTGLRRLSLLGCGLLLFVLGQFEEQVFAELLGLWLGLFTSDTFYWATKKLANLNGLSTHALPVAVTYRLLYCSISVLMAHMLLRGNGTKLIASGYMAVLVGSLLLLLLGQKLHFPLVSQQAHRLLDLVCSPLALLLAYALVSLGSKSSHLKM